MAHYSSVSPAWNKPLGKQAGRPDQPRSLAATPALRGLDIRAKAGAQVTGL